MKASVAIWVLGFACDAASAQDKPKFEVASIRPFVPKPGSARTAAPQNPEHFAMSTALRSLIVRAYGLETYQLVGPDSLATVWTIAGNAAPGTTQAQQNLMIQSLLEERFHLTFHHEMKEFKVYDLVVTKGGLKLKDSIPTDGCSMDASSVRGKACGPLSEQFGLAKAAKEGPDLIMTSPDGLHAGTNLTISLLAQYIRLDAGQIVIDRTGIEGRFDIRMQYPTIDRRTGRPFHEDSPLPTIFDALQQQLGLKLEPAKAMIEMTIVDHIDATPTDN